jgi:hypothetical protein
MKRVYAISTAIILSMAITGCGNQPELTKNDLQNKTKVSNLYVMPIQTPVKLAERTKAQAIGNALVGVAVGTALGSNTGARTPNELANNTKIAMNFSKIVAHALPDSSIVDQGGGIDMLIANKMSSYVSEKYPNDPKKQKKLYLSVNTPRWEIGFKNMFSEDYYLNYHITSSIIEKDENENEKVIDLTKAECRGTYDKSMPLDDWKANNYKEVQSASEMISEQCYEQLVGTLSI